MNSVKMNKAIVIRPLHTISELAKVEALMRAIWGMSDLEIVSTHTLHAMVHSGGQILAAFDGAQMVGFVVSIIGTRSGSQLPAAERLQIYSFIAGVAQAYQNQQVGVALKLAQRNFALSLDIPLISWTYDPLESRNAHFNIGKLGAICNQYHLNFHGEMSGINAGIPTDRFEAQWWVMSDGVAACSRGEKRPLSLTRLREQGAVLLNPTNRNEAGLPLPPQAVIHSDHALLLVEIPAHYQQIKQQAFPLAQQWRQHTQTLFTTYFKKGYTVTDFVTDKSEEARSSFYVLTK